MDILFGNTEYALRKKTGFPSSITSLSSLDVDYTTKRCHITLLSIVVGHHWVKVKQLRLTFSMRRPALRPRQGGRVIRVFWTKVGKDLVLRTRECWALWSIHWNWILWVFKTTYEDYQWLELWNSSHRNKNRHKFTYIGDKKYNNNNLQRTTRRIHCKCTDSILDCIFFDLIQFIICLIDLYHFLIDIHIIPDLLVINLQFKVPYLIQFPVVSSSSPKAPLLCILLN